MVTVAPVTTRARRLPCVANLDTLTTVPKRALVERVVLLTPEKLRAVEDALRFALGLEG